MKGSIHGSLLFVALLYFPSTTQAFSSRMKLTSSKSITTTTSLYASTGNNGLEHLQAILFDQDGVLADTERDAHRPAFNQVFVEEGLDTEWTVDMYGKLLETGGGKERMTAHWTAVGWPESMKDLSDEEKQAKVKDFHLKKTEVFMEKINQGDVPLRPGVLRLIDDAIAAGLTLAVCSTSSELAVRNLVNSES